MFEIRLNNVVEKIVENELIEKGGKEGEALHFHFDVKLSYIGKVGKEYRQSRGLHLLYHIFPGSAYVNVFSGVTDSPFGKRWEVKEWEHEASHDSCWRSVSIFSNLYFEMANLINAARIKDRYKKIAPIKMNQYVNFCLFDALYRWVPVEIVRPDPNDSYKKAVKLL